MIATHLIFNIAERRGLTSDVHAMSSQVDTTCYLCGTQVDKAVPVRERIGSTWTAHDLAQAPLSEWLCLPCFFCLQEKCNARPDISPKFTFRAFSHFVTKHQWDVIRLNEKRRLLAWLFSPPQEDWAMAICTSSTGSPHILPFTPVNNAGETNWKVNFGGQIVRSRSDELRLLYDAVTNLYAHGFKKTEILSGNYSSFTVFQKPELFFACEDRISHQRGSLVFELAVFLAQKERNEQQ